MSNKVVSTFAEWRHIDRFREIWGFAYPHLWRHFREISTVNILSGSSSQHAEDVRDCRKKRQRKWLSEKFHQFGILWISQYNTTRILTLSSTFWSLIWAPHRDWLSVSGVTASVSIFSHSCPIQTGRLTREAIWIRRNNKTNQEDSYQVPAEPFTGQVTYWCQKQEISPHEDLRSEVKT